MKTLETDPRLPKWANDFLNFIAVPVEWIRTVAVSYGGNESSEASPDWTGLYLEGKGSLFYNGVLFVRAVFPFGFWLHVRWKRTGRAFLQTGVGYKVNGRFGLTFRIQSDETAERGTTGPNYGQAKGWARGPH